MKIIFSVFFASLILFTSSTALAQHCDVKKGESLWIIAKKYHVDFQKLLELNKHFPNQDLIFPKDEVELPDDTTTTDRNENTQAVEVLNLVNAERKKQGLQSLVLDKKLTEVANAKAKDMKDKNYFSHNSPTYGTPFQMLNQFGVNYSSAGENIAAGQQTSKAVMTSWMNSSGHRANILNAKYKKLGVGLSLGGRYGTYWVQVFTS